MVEIGGDGVFVRGSEVGRICRDMGAIMYCVGGWMGCCCCCCCWRGDGISSVGDGGDGDVGEWQSLSGGVTGSEDLLSVTSRLLLSCR